MNEEREINLTYDDMSDKIIDSHTKQIQPYLYKPKKPIDSMTYFKRVLLVILFFAFIYTLTHNG